MNKISIVLKQYFKSALQKTLLPFYYSLYKNKPVKKNYVILADSNCDSTPDSMICMEECLKSNGYDVSEMYLDFSGHGLKSIMKYMLDFMKEYAVAETVFICNYFVPVTSCKKRKETTVVQLWHGAGCLKKFGYDSADDISVHYKGSVTKNIDLITVSSPECVKPFSSAFRLNDDTVKPMGISRTDMFFEADFKQRCIDEFYKEYPQYKCKKIILYAPTFRGNASGAYCVGQEYASQLQNKLGDDYVVLIKMHPRLKSDLTNCNIETNRLFPVVDLLITDYSSLVFEYSLLGKPLLLFCPDYEEYSKSRSFYLDFENEMPAKIITDGEKLAVEVINSLENYDQKKMQAFADKYMSSCDGHSSSRILEYIRR